MIRNRLSQYKQKRLLELVVVSGTRRPVYGFSVATVQRERYTQFFPIITGGLEAVIAPPLVTFPKRYFPCMRPFRGKYCRFTLKQQRILTHDSVYAFGINNGHVVRFRLPATPGDNHT